MPVESISNKDVEEDKFFLYARPLISRAKITYMCDSVDDIHDI